MYEKYSDWGLVPVLKHFVSVPQLTQLITIKVWTIHFKQSILTLMYQSITNLLNELICEQIPTYKQLNQKIDNHCSKGSGWLRPTLYYLDLNNRSYITINEFYHWTKFTNYLMT